ncbi:MAG: hypothetical protein RJA82_376 [Pseudomonadota bacterium]
MLGQPTAIESGFLSRSHRPVGCLACPARFERATYALEGRCSIQLSYGQMDFFDFNGMLESWEFGIGL